MAILIQTSDNYWGQRRTLYNDKWSSDQEYTAILTVYALIGRAANYMTRKRTVERNPHTAREDYTLLSTIDRKLIRKDLEINNNIIH